MQSCGEAETKSCGEFLQFPVHLKQKCWEKPTKRLLEIYHSLDYDTNERTFQVLIIEMYCFLKNGGKRNEHKEKTVAWDSRWSDHYVPLRLSPAGE